MKNSAMYCLVALLAVAELSLSVAGRPHRRSVSSEPTTSTEAAAFAYSADELRELARGIMKDATKKLFPYVQDFAYDQNLPQECISSLFKLSQGFRSNKLWAFKFIDSMGRPPAGLLEGSMGALGSYDECLSIAVPGADDESIAFRGQYCTLYVKPELNDRWLDVLQRSLDQYPLPVRKRLQNVTNLKQFYGHWLVGGMRLGVCLPSACSGKDLKYMVDKFAKPLKINTKISACAVDKFVTFTNLQLFMICLLGVLGLLLLSASTLELWLIFCHRGSRKDLEKPLCLQLLLSFSAISNTSALLDRSSSKDTDAQRLRCLHGIRVISYLWITLCHNYAILDPHIMLRGMKALDIIDEFGFTVIINGMLSVETFFLLSGFLLAFGILKEVKRKKSVWFLLPVTVVMRYIRLTVPGAFLVGVFFLYPLLVSGPLVDDVVQYLVNNVCRRNWWHVLVHVSNLQHPVDVCLPTLWYIACDYQLFLATILLVFLLAKKPMAGAVCLAAVALSACVAVGVQHYVSAFEPLPYTYISDLNLFFKGHGAMYLWPTGHVTSFVVGVLTAFCFHRYSHVRFGKAAYAVCWTLSVVAALTVLYAVFDWNSRGSYVLAWVSTYAGLHRLAWGLAVSWVVFVCATGQAAPVNRLLSLDVHSVYFTHWLMVRDYLGHLVLIYMFAYLMYLLCECPTVKLSKMALNGLTHASSKDTRKDTKSSVSQNRL
ncbi:hypothetical protein MRX96_001387 [Rhipicephalus microplus]